jgi:hypothetical protein
MTRQRDETLSESLTRYIYGLVFWLLTVGVIVVETNWILGLSAPARNLVGAVVLLGVFALGVAFALVLRSARDGDEVKDLLRTALENPGRIQYQLGALKKAAEDWRVEALTEAGVDAVEVYAGGEKLE